MMVGLRVRFREELGDGQDLGQTGLHQKCHIFPVDLRDALYEYNFYSWLGINLQRGESGLYISKCHQQTQAATAAIHFVHTCLRLL